MVLVHTAAATSFTRSVNSSSSVLSRVLLGAVKPDRRYSSSRNKLSKLFFGSALSWTVPSCWSSCSRSKAFQHARTPIELRQVLAMLTEDQIPPMSTILHYLIPPLEPSSYADEAVSILTDIASGWGMQPNPILDIYKTTGVQCAMYFHPRTASADRLAAISLFYWILYMLDEACFDLSDSRLVALAEEVGIDSTMRHDRSRLGSFWKRLRNLFTSTELPLVSVPVEKAVWDTGRLMRSLTASETWFDSFVEAVEIYASSSFELHFHGNVASEVTSHQELEAFIDARVGNAGGDLVCTAIELATGKFLSAEARNHPKIQRLRQISCRFTALQNDLCSYHKEVFVDKETAGNTIQVMMKLDNLSFAQAVQKLMSIMVAESCEFLELEKDPQVAEMTACELTYLA